MRIIHSPFGQVLKAIKENEPRSISLGYDTQRFKLLAFVLSAALAGLAGSLKTLVLGFATLSDVHWTASGQVVLMTLVGGMGTLSGPILGSALVILLENKIGEIDTELFREFFQALVINAGITLHIENFYFDNNHHLAESMFKAVARALRDAVEIDPRAADRVPSTKGTL